VVPDILKDGIAFILKGHSVWTGYT